MNMPWVVVGIGNPYRQDDRAGLVVIEQLEQAGLPCRTDMVYSAGLEVLDQIRGFKRAIIVDACQLGKEPGTILEALAEDLFAVPSSANAHGITLGATLQTGYLCFPEEMPDDIRIILIEVKELEPFTERLSPEVEAAVAEVVARIRVRIGATV
jgi:hydrogenase maturation protease